MFSNVFQRIFRPSANDVPAVRSRREFLKCLGAVAVGCMAGFVGAGKACAALAGAVRKWINVKHAPYFAAGDGRADDTGAIRAALADAARDPEPCVVLLPTGNYRITSTIELPRGGSSAADSPAA